MKRDRQAVRCSRASSASFLEVGAAAGAYATVGPLLVLRQLPPGREVLPDEGVMDTLVQLEVEDRKPVSSCSGRPFAMQIKPPRTSRLTGLCIRFRLQMVI